MRIVYKNGVPCKVDAQGRLIKSKFKPYGGRYQEDTMCIRIPVSLAPEVLKLCNDLALQVVAQRAVLADNPNYTTPGYEDAEVVEC